MKPKFIRLSSASNLPTDNPAHKVLLLNTAAIASIASYYLDRSITVVCMIGANDSDFFLVTESPEQIITMIEYQS